MKNISLLLRKNIVIVILMTFVTSCVAADQTIDQRIAQAQTLLGQYQSNAQLLKSPAAQNVSITIISGDPTTLDYYVKDIPATPLFDQVKEVLATLDPIDATKVTQPQKASITKILYDLETTMATLLGLQSFEDKLTNQTATIGDLYTRLKANLEANKASAIALSAQTTNDAKAQLAKLPNDFFASKKADKSKAQFIFDYLKIGTFDQNLQGYVRGNMTLNGIQNSITDAYYKFDLTNMSQNDLANLQAAIDWAAATLTGDALQGRLIEINGMLNGTYNNDDLPFGAYKDVASFTKYVNDNLVNIKQRSLKIKGNPDAAKSTNPLLKK